MKKFKLLLISFAISILWIVFGTIRLSGNKTPDAEFEIFNYIVVGTLLMGLGLLLDLFFIFTGSRKPAIQNRRSFWRIISGLAVIGVIYLAYVLLFS